MGGRYTPGSDEEEDSDDAATCISDRAGQLSNSPCTYNELLPVIATLSLRSCNPNMMLAYLLRPAHRDATTRPKRSVGTPYANTGGAAATRGSVFS